MAPEPHPVPVATTPAPTGSSNTLALFSFFASLYPLAVILLSIGSAFFHPLAIAVGFLGILTLPALILAIVLGHVAYSQAKRYAPENSYRGFAIAGFVIGYLELAVLLLFVGLIIYAATHFS